MYYSFIFLAFSSLACVLLSHSLSHVAYICFAFFFFFCYILFLIHDTTRQKDRRAKRQKSIEAVCLDQVG